MLQILTILKESLWSAAASRLLYIELVGVVLFLIALLPMGYNETINYQVTPMDVTSPERLALILAGKQNGNVDAKFLQQLDQQLDAEDKQALQDMTESEDGSPIDLGRRSRRRLVEILNGLIDTTPLESFEGVGQQLELSEARDLLQDLGSLSDEKTKRLRRLILQDRLGVVLRPPVASRVSVYYAAWGPVNVPGASHRQLEELVRGWIPFVLDKVFLTAGILIAVLITASLIPQMLEEGSLYLQLSKPIPRWLLLLTKYVGSGMLVFIIGASLLTGLWVILGLRMGMWINELLWFIPLAVALYLIYFSVTVTFGLLFRNTIIAILGTLAFAGICYSLSFTVWFADQFMRLQRRGAVVQLEEKIYSYDSLGKMFELDNSDDWKWVYYYQGRQMQEVEVSMMSSFYSPPGIPQAYLLKQHGVVVGEMGDISVPNEMRTYFGAAKLDNPGMMQRPRAFGQAPEGLVGFAETASGKLLGVSQYGTVWQLSDDGMQEILSVTSGEKKQAPTILADGEEEAADPEPQNLDWNILGSINPAGPDSVSRFVYDPEQDVFWAIGRQSITRAARNGSGAYEIQRTFQFPWSWSQTNRTPITKVNDSLIVPLRQGPVVVLDASTLEVKQELKLPFRNVPVAATSYGDKAALAYLKDGVWIYDATTSELKKLPRSGMILTADFNDAGQLLVVRDVDRLEWIDAETGQVDKSIQPGRSTIRWAFEVFVKPLHAVLPKPNECYALVESMATANNQDTVGNSEQSDEKAVNVEAISADASNPWNPLLSSCGFAIVLMTLNCLYFSRQQF